MSTTHSRTESTTDQLTTQALWQKRLQSVEPAVLLVEARLLRRVARLSQEMSVLTWRVPHEEVYVLEREALLDLATEQELGIYRSGELPARVILIAWPHHVRQEGQVQEILTRRLVHGWTHYYWRSVPEDQQERFILTRIEQLGAAEWEEIRAVADQDRWLPRHREPAYAIYQEFAAHWLEWWLVCPERLDIWFPTLARQAERITQLLSQDVAIAELERRLHQARLLERKPANGHSSSCSSGTLSWAPSQLPVDILAHKSAEQSGPSVAAAEDLASIESLQPKLASLRNSREWQRITTLAQRGNLVGAARWCWQCAVQADETIRFWWQDQARHFTRQLAERLASLFRSNGPILQEALAEPMPWERALWPLIPPAAAHGFYSEEARLLYDLQRLSEDGHRGVYVVDVAGWLRTLGKLPWQRQQPFLQRFLVLRRLRGASDRLALCRLDESARSQLAALLHSAIQQREAELRQQVLPILRRVLEDAGLVPEHLTERIEQERLLEELADRIVETGHLTLGELRDAISRNQLKLSDVSGVREWWQGDALLAADKRLSFELDGVYRRGEVYLRWFQRFSSLFFGTWIGRLVSLYGILPFAGAYIILEGFDHVLVHPLARWLGFSFHISGHFQVLALGLFLLAVINSSRFRWATVRWMRYGWAGLRWLFWELPKQMFQWPPWRRLWQSAIVVFFRQYLSLPLLFGVAAYLLCQVLAIGSPWLQLVVGLSALAGLPVALTREGRILLATAGDYLAWTFRYLSWEWIVLGFHWIVALFQRLLHYIELVQYRVDEWLRYRGGASRWQLLWKAPATLLWAWIAYLLRFTVYLLIEPQINPIKHFPVVTVSHKLLLASVPFFSTVTLNALGGEDTPANRARAVALVTSVIWAIPGIFGFLAWELKENWKLYRANRTRTLRPLRIGHHGEAVPQLLRPGAHSGTLRKLYRQARRLYASGWIVPTASQMARWQAQHHRVAEAIHRFVERNLLFPLQHVAHWNGPELAVEAVWLGISTVEICLSAHARSTEGIAGTSSAPAVFRISCQGGWIVAQWRQMGWLADLSAEARHTLQHALLGLYHWAGVEVVADHWQQWLSPQYFWQLEWHGLRLYNRDQPDQQAFYPWREAGLVEAEDGTMGYWPSFNAEQLWFNTQELSWDTWEAGWQDPSVTARILAEREIILLPRAAALQS